MKFLFLLLCILFLSCNKNFDGKWEYIITYENNSIQTGVVIFNKNIINIDNTAYIYSINNKFLFINNLGYYYKIKFNILILTPAFGDYRHIIKMKRIK